MSIKKEKDEQAKKERQAFGTVGFRDAVHTEIEKDRAELAADPAERTKRLNENRWKTDLEEDVRVLQARHWPWPWPMAQAAILAVLASCVVMYFTRPRPASPPSHGGTEIQLSPHEDNKLVPNQLPVAGQSGNVLAGPTIEIEAKPVPSTPPARFRVRVSQRCWIQVEDSAGGPMLGQNGRWLKSGGSIVFSMGPGLGCLPPRTLRAGCPGHIFYSVDGRMVTLANHAQHPDKVELVTLP